MGISKTINLSHNQSSNNSHCIQNNDIIFKKRLRRLIYHRMKKSKKPVNKTSFTSKEPMHKNNKKKQVNPIRYLLENPRSISFEDFLDTWLLGTYPRLNKNPHRFFGEGLLFDLCSRSQTAIAELLTR